jgi:hypothetical protein
MRLSLEYQKGAIDEETYHKNEDEILKDLNSISEQKKGFN